MHDTIQDGPLSAGLRGRRDESGQLGKVLETSPVGITVVDAGGEITFANRKAEEILGLAKSEITGRIYNEPEWRITTFEGGLFPDEELPFQKVRDTGKVVENVRYAIVWPDGRIVCLSIKASPLTDAGGGFAGMVTSLEDVTEAVETERALLQRQNRAYKVISLCNAALIHATDETSLLKEVCRIVVEDGGYRFAWTAYTEEDGSKKVKPVAQCGFEEGYLDAITITWDETDTGFGPTGTAIRTEQPAHARNILSDPAYAPWRDEALKHGYASSLSLPLIADSNTIGALNIYAAEADAFNPGEECLLMQMANDLAYGITTLRVREEQKKNLVKLTESESRYRTLVEHAADGIFIIDGRGKYVDANQSGLDMLGYSHDEMLEMHVTDIVSKNDMEQTPIKLDLLLAGETLTTERELVRKDGSIVPVELSAKMMPNGDILGIHRDISARKFAERELRESREDWQRIFRSISDPVMILDLDQNILAANPAAEKNLGLSLDRILGRKSYDVFRSLDEAAEGCPFKSLIESGGAVATEEMEIEAVGGTFLVTVSPIFDSEGKLSKVLHIAKDITERKRAEEAQRLFRTLLDQSTDGIEVFDPETGRLLEVNDRYCLTHGYSKEELLDLTIFDIDPTVDRSEYKKNLKHLRQTGSMLWEGEHRRKDGTSFPVEVAIRYVKLDRDYMVTNVRDITERKRAENALRENQARLDLALQSANMGVWHWDLIENKRYFDNQAGHLLGINPATFTGAAEEFLGAVHPDDRETIKLALARTIEQDVLYEPEYRAVWPDGSVHYITARGRLVRDDKGRPLRINGIIWDITERQQAKEKVKQYSMLLNAVRRALVKFINDPDLTAVFEELLYRILLLTNSKFGLIGEVRNNADGQPYLCTHAKAYLTGAQQAKKQAPHFEFHKMDMLLGDAIAKGEPVIMNDVPGDPRRGELNEGHPEITSFLGLPFKSGDRVVGVVAIANSQDGYDEELVSYLGLLLITCTSIVEAYRNDQLRLQSEENLVKSYETLNNTFDGVVRALASTSESRDPYTAGHQERVSRLAAAIAQELGLSEDQIKGIRMAGLLHDLGKMSVPVEILSKPGKINEHELNIIKLHTTVGNDILSSIEFPWPVARIAHQHHERMDGSGYPLGLKGDEISLEARILAVADVVEAMSSHRPYRAAKGIDAALDEIAQQSGILYDPDVADACLRLFRENGYELDEV